jgi:hypothetical protein
VPDDDEAAVGGDGDGRVPLLLGSIGVDVKLGADRSSGLV